MSLNFGAVVINVLDMEKSKNFWKEALGFEVVEDNADWISLSNPNRAATRLDLQQTDHPKQSLNRIHFDLYADDAPAEVERLKGIGASIIPWPFYSPDSGFLVMTDPEGNEFCVIGKNLENYRKEYSV